MHILVGAAPEASVHGRAGDDHMQPGLPGNTASSTLASPVSATGQRDSDFPATPRPSSTRGQAFAHKLPEGVQGCFVSIGRNGFRRLHYAGACPRVPGLDYKNFEEMGLSLPDASEYNDYCRSCWRGDARPAEDDDEAEVSSAASSSDEERPRRGYI